MDNYKIKVNDEAESKEAQELFELLGFKWAGDHPENGWYSHLYAENSTCCYLAPYVWGGLGDRFKELTLPQLRDLVVLHRNDIHDANWVTEGDDQIYQDSNGKSFIFREQGWDELQRHEMRQAMWKKVKPKPQPTEPEQCLISGADALRALADGQLVQWMTGDAFQDVTDEWQIREFSHPSFKFRLKPRTIKLELEIPAPFEPKTGEIFYYISDEHASGYAHSTLWCEHKDDIWIGMWRTEEEIKQVVAALRGIKG
ncbi:hypothetical protein [Acinetobacter sp. IK40]|uniref:hypothetical protein n=1 Tax=Acinetobacter sp. IK40 TaxID=2928897 RepID=UPI002D1EB486|nr:hypothetical protein [Acinetobacter sp. IK40]MEB3790110.1 hypothetical protein [Acinetobacter sp. IK40]